MQREQGAGVGWYVVHTKPRQEKLAVSHLDRQGYETYLPMIEERRRKENRYQVQSVPMFPRYLFIRLTPTAASTAPIRSTIGCCGLVRFGNELAQLAAPIITHLRARERANGGVSRAPEWPVGSPLRVTDGPFLGMDATFLSRSAAERVIVLMEMLGREQQVELPDHLLAPVEV